MTNSGGVTASHWLRRKIGEVGAAEHLQEAQRFIAGVLDVVTHRERYVAHVAGLVVEGAGLAGRGEHGHAPAAADVVLPLVGVRVPMQLAHPARLNLHQRRRDGGSSRKIRRVDDADLASGRLDRLLGRRR